MASPPFGRLVRRHRHRLQMSQEKLAERAGISPRHMSFLENGKAQPSREIALEIANALEVPTPEIGVFLEVAGYVVPTETPVATRDNELPNLLRALSDPALMHDRYGSMLAVNAQCMALFSMFVSPEQLSANEHGHAWFELLRPKMRNWGEFQAFYRRRVFLELLRSGSGDPELERLVRRWSGDGESMRDMSGAVARAVMDWQGKIAEFRLLTATLGTPSDVALRDFRIALVLPGNGLATELVGRAAKMCSAGSGVRPMFPVSA